MGNAKSVDTSKDDLPYQAVMLLSSSEFLKLKNEFCSRRDGSLSKKDGQRLVDKLDGLGPLTLGEKARLLLYIDEMPGQTITISGLLSRLDPTDLSESAHSLVSTDLQVAGRTLTLAEFRRLPEREAKRFTQFDLVNANESGSFMASRDVLLVIFGMMKYSEVFNCALVCRKFANAANLLLSFVRPPRALIVKLCSDWNDAAPSISLADGEQDSSWAIHRQLGVLVVDQWHRRVIVSSAKMKDPFGASISLVGVNALHLGDFVCFFVSRNLSFVHLHRPSGSLSAFCIPLLEHNSIIFQGRGMLFAFEALSNAVIEFRLSNSQKLHQSFLLCEGCWLVWERFPLGVPDFPLSQMIPSFPNSIYFPVSRSKFLSQVIVYNSGSRLFHRKPCGGFVPIENMNQTFLQVRENVLMHHFTTSTFFNLGELVFLKIEAEHAFWVRSHISSAVACDEKYHRLIAPGIIEFQNCGRKGNMTLLLCVDTILPEGYAKDHEVVEILQGKPVHLSESIFKPDEE